MRRCLSFEISVKRKKSPVFAGDISKIVSFLRELLLGFVGVSNDHQDTGDGVDEDKGAD